MRAWSHPQPPFIATLSHGGDGGGDGGGGGGDDGGGGRKGRHLRTQAIVSEGDDGAWIRDGQRAVGNCAPLTGEPPRELPR